jgi:hypothetical protein
MTNSFMKKLRTATGGLLALVLCTGFPALSNAALLQIHFTGLDLVYDGKDIHDSGGKGGGELIPTDSDPLDFVNFKDESGKSFGKFFNEIYADLLIWNVLEIPVNGGTVYSKQSTENGNYGLFDLFGKDWRLQLNLDSPFEVNYDATGLLTLKGSATTKDIYDQLLPFGLTVGTPITLSFSVSMLGKVTKDNNGNFLTNFTASGTGEVVAPTVPEPSVLLLMGSGLVALGFARRIRRRTEGV